MIIFTNYIQLAMVNYKYIVFFFLLNFLAFSQSQFEIASPDFIKTIVFKSNTNEGQLPIFKLNEKLTLEFDALTADEGDFYYEIVHCDFDWSPSRLMKSEYMQGFDNQRIVNYENSFNTYQIYSHYKLEIPNQQTQLKVSGNYLMKIYNDYDELMFTRKFMIYEELSNVGVSIKRSRDVRYIDNKQSVDFKINSPYLGLLILNKPLKHWLFKTTI